MSFLHKVLAKTYRPLRFYNTISHSIGLKSREGTLRALIYHDVSPEKQEKFARQLRWLSHDWNFVSPEQFASMVRGNEPVCGRNLLITFDDSFLSNRRVADAILNPMGIKALFFVVSDFIELDDINAQREFVIRRLYPGMNDVVLPSDCQSMSWNDLEYLLENGHAIGAHTKSHARLSELKTEFEWADEAVGCGDYLESKLGIPIQYFAYPFGNLSSISPPALSTIKKRFPFTFSGLRGDNARGVSPWALRRDAMSFDDSPSLVGAFLEGGADFLYAKDLLRLDTWGKS